MMTTNQQWNDKNCSTNSSMVCQKGKAPRLGSTKQSRVNPLSNQHQFQLYSLNESTKNNPQREKCVEKMRLSSSRPDSKLQLLS